MQNWRKLMDLSFFQFSPSGVHVSLMFLIFSINAKLLYFLIAKKALMLG